MYEIYVETYVTFRLVSFIPRVLRTGSERSIDRKTHQISIIEIDN